MGQFWWYVARSAGVVAWAVLTLSVIWGLLLSTKAAGSRVRRPWLLDLHRFLGGIGLAFVAVHALAIVADSYVHVSLVDLVVPFASNWRPAPVAWGVIALWLAVAVEATSLARRHLSKKTWRTVHMASFGAFWMATLHGLTAGTDATSAWFRVLVFGGTAVVAGLTALRIFQATGPDAVAAPVRTPAEPAARAPRPGQPQAPASFPPPPFPAHGPRVTTGAGAPAAPPLAPPVAWPTAPPARTSEEVPRVPVA